MKTVIRITNNYQSDDAHREWKEDISYFVNEELKPLQAVTGNNRFQNVVEDVKDYSVEESELENVSTVVAKGYVQGDWQEYTIYHNQDREDEKFVKFLELLKRSFTHKNDYWVEKFERTGIDGKTFDAQPHDHTSFSITHIEFPSEEDVLKEYQDIYGKDFDEYEINID